MSEKLLKGEVVITIDSRDKICIELKDVVAGVKCVEIEIDPEAFAFAMHHRPSPCEFAWRPKHVGMKHESKEENVPFNSAYRVDKVITERAIDMALKPFEVDGWEARREDVGNHRRRCKTEEGSTEQEAYRVYFHRWVQPTP